MTNINSRNHQIPKIIHWCWVGPDRPSRLVNNCIKSWRKYMPDYEIRIWDCDRFDINAVPFVKAAFNAKKWAFVADYIRLYALYNYGGIYLDSDVKVKKTFDEFLNYKVFLGSEPFNKEKTIMGVEAAIIGSEKGHPYFRDCLDYYENLDVDFNNLKMKDWGSKIPMCPDIMSKVLTNYGFKYENKSQVYKDNIKFLDSTYFGHGFWELKEKNYYAIHCYMGSWKEIKRGKFYKWCYNNDFIPLYYFIQKFTKSFYKNKGKE